MPCFIGFRNREAVGDERRAIQPDAAAHGRQGIGNPVEAVPRDLSRRGSAPLPGAGDASAAMRPKGSGPHRTATTGGAMHLTSTPNTLQTETGLAGAATILLLESSPL